MGLHVRKHGRARAGQHEVSSPSVLWRRPLTLVAVAHFSILSPQGVIQLAAHLTVLAVLTTSPPVAAAPAPVSRADSLNESLHIDVTGIEEAAGPDGTMSSSSSSEAESDGEAAAPSATLGEAAAPVIPVGEAAAPVVTVEEVR